MTNLINDFLSQPLWLSIPLIMVYLALLAYFLYILWHYRRKSTLAVVLTIVALMTGQQVWADNGWDVELSKYDSSAKVATFKITRTDKTYAQTVLYRTVGLSAFAGQHYTAVSGEVTFGVGDDTKTVTVTEKSPGENADAYLYQKGTSNRTYMLEVTDIGGFTLATSNTHSMTNGTSFNGSYVNKSVTDLVYFQDGNVKSGSGNKYLDVAHSGTKDTEKMIDDGYDYNDNTLCTVSTGNLYNSSSDNSALRTWLNGLGYKMYATVFFQQREENDGYQYIQILADNATTYDGKDGDGKIDNGPTTSLYKAAFILTKNENVCTSWKYQAFPHKSDDHTSSTEFDYSDSYLYAQAFKSHTPSYRATTSGSLVLATNVNDINVRFDANGSGEDTWYLKNLRVRLALVDATAPTKLAVSVAPGKHARGNTVYVSVAFNEIVTATSSTKLTSNWGDLTYVDGTGSNVLTFKRTIPASASEALSIKGCSGITDLAGNAPSSVSTDNICSIDASYAYPITYNLNEGTLPDGYPTTYTYESAVTLSNPSKTGYTFTGWTGSNGNTPSTSVTIAQYSHGDKSYTANWTANQYTVTIDQQGGDGGSESATATYDAAMPDLTMPTKTGYTFDGYYTETNGGGTKYYNADGTSANNWNIASDTILYAKWTANEYTVTLDMQGGDSGSESATATYDAAMPDITVPTKTGYTFDGYYTETNGGGTKYYNADGTSANNWNIVSATTLFAKWTIPTGTCGTSAMWEYDHATTTLTISGSGAVGSYAANNAPWQNYKPYITTVSIGSDITSITGLPFADCTALTSVTGGDGLITVNYGAFINTPWRTEAETSTSVVYLGHTAFCGRGVSGNITIKDGIVYIVGEAFRGNSDITSVTIPASVTSIGVSAFYDCSSLTTVNVLPATAPTLGSSAFSFSDSNHPDRIFNVRSAVYKTASGWEKISNLRVISTLTLPDGVTASVADGNKVTILDTDYYVEGATVTLTLEPGSYLTSDVTVNGTPATDNGDGTWSFNMPAEDATVSATVMEYKITVNEGTDADYNVPFSSFYCDRGAHSQFIIPAADLTAMQWGDINKMTFFSNTASVSWKDAEYDVYFAEVDFTTFEDGAWMNGATIVYDYNGELVYRGSVSVSDNKMEITLDSPFPYSGGNLWVYFEETNCSPEHGPEMSWYGKTQTDYTAVFDNYGYGAAKFLPKITFGYTPAPSCIPPTALTVSEVTNHTATISWTPINDQAAWHVYYSTNPTAPADDIDLNKVIDVTTSPTYTFTGLESSTKYYFWVRGNCDVNDHSSWVGSDFTTDIPCTPPTALTVTNITPTSATIGWTSYGDNFDVEYAELPDASSEYKYDNDVYDHSMKGIYAGVLFPAGSITESNIRKISVYDPYLIIESYVNGGAVCPLWICYGSATAPDLANPIYTGDVILEGANTFIDIPVNVAVDNTQNLWIVMQGDREKFSLPICNDHSGSDATANGRWYSEDGSSWRNDKISDSYSYHVWMIRVSLDEGGYTWSETKTCDTNSYNITGLNADKDYAVRVRQNCGGIDGVSIWRGTIFSLTTTPVVFAKEGFSTAYYSQYDLVLPAGMKAKIVTANDSGTLTYQTIADGDTSDKTVPADTPVMLQTAANSTIQTLDVPIAAPKASAITATNYLHGSDTQCTTTGDGKHYKLTYGDANVDFEFGWYWGDDDGAPFTSVAHKAWLVLPNTVSAQFFGLPDFDDEEQTGISSLTPDPSPKGEGSDYYTLDGRKINGKPTKKGIFINNGRKVVIK